MTNSSDYVPPKVWTWNKASGGQFANINRPIAGPTHDKELPVGRHPLQLYSLATPNGVKVTVMLEELLALGHSGAEYDAWLIKIGERRSVRQRLRGGQSELQDSRADGPQRPEADPRLRVRRDPALSRREVRGLPADRQHPRRMPVLAVLADGSSALSRRRLRSLLRLCADEDRIRHRSLRHGGEAPARRARQAARRQRIHGGQRLHDRRYGDLALVWRPGEGRALRGGRVPVGAGLQACSALGRADRQAPGRPARTNGQPLLRRALESAARAA